MRAGSLTFYVNCESSRQTSKLFNNTKCVKQPNACIRESVVGDIDAH